MRYLIVIEKTGTGYSAYSPDLDGCIATGATREEVERAMREAIQRDEFNRWRSRFIERYNAGAHGGANAVG